MKGVYLILVAVCLLGAASAYDYEPTQEESLLDLAAAQKARHASYQSNVGTVYKHLNEIIRKILVHKKAWSVKYESDLKRVAKELAEKVKKERAARSGKDKADNALAVAKAEASRKDKAWIKANSQYKQKKIDAAREKADLNSVFKKGNGMKAGEIEMIVRIRCMLSTFNKDSKYDCADMPAAIAEASGAAGGAARKAAVMPKKGGSCSPHRGSSEALVIGRCNALPKLKKYSFAGIKARSGSIPTNTRAVFVTRSGSWSKGELNKYVVNGGIVLTEYSVGTKVYNEVFGTNYPRQGSSGGCSDLVQPAVQMDKGGDFWKNVAYHKPARTGCGYTLDHLPAITKLGGWTAAKTSLAYKDFGRGRVYFLEADWQDGEASGAWEKSVGNGPFFKSLLKYLC
jgi:hypothetical protein